MTTECVHCGSDRDDACFHPATPAPCWTEDSKTRFWISQMSETAAWWTGTVIPTGQYRLKMREITLPRDSGCTILPLLQQLVRPPGGGRGRWIDMPLIENGDSDVE